MPLVTLRTFLTSGSLGLVGLGAERALVETTFGPPDDFSAGSQKYQLAQIWRYGDVELHFDGDKVRLIHVDRFSGPRNSPVAGAAVDLDPWVIAEGLSLDALTEALKRAGLEHTVLTQPDLDRTLLILPSGVELGFSSASRHDARLEFVSRGH